MPHYCALGELRTVNVWMGTAGTVTALLMIVMIMVILKMEVLIVIMMVMIMIIIIVQIIGPALRRGRQQAQESITGLVCWQSGSHIQLLFFLKTDSRAVFCFVHPAAHPPPACSSWPDNVSAHANKSINIYIYIYYIYIYIYI